MHQVEINVKGQLDSHWSEWLAGLTITHTGENKTTLAGSVTDQAAVYGLLTKVRDLGLTLISVSITGPDDCDDWEIPEALANDLWKDTDKSQPPHPSGTKKVS